MKIKKLTKDDAKVEFVIEWLTTTHLDTEGGYPYDYAKHQDGTVYVASLEHDGSTKITEYSPQTLCDWYDSAVEYLNYHHAGEDPDKDDLWSEAFYETMSQHESK